MSMRTILSAVLVGVFAMASPGALAQDEQDTADDEQILDTVVVTGSQNDNAMAAFRAGDFKTAEVEFLDNATCALRRERNRLAGIESIQTSQTRADIAGSAASSAVSTDANGGVSLDGSSAAQSLNSVSNSSAYNAETRKDRSCENRAFQMYMAGLSQIQLGKTDEALTNFKRSTTLSKTLYDAHYKIGLIMLLQGDQKEAEKQLTKVEGILARCLRCDARQEIIDRKEHLAKALSGEVSLQ